jgi:PKD repeat protein
MSSGPFTVCPPVSHTYTSAGSYTVSLLVIGTTSVFTNGLTRPNYIQVGGTSTLTPTRTPTPTPVVTGGTCSPVSATITAPFTKDGAGTFCWQSSNLGGFINSWNTASVTVNGTNYTNLWAATSSLPAKISGFWYVSYTGNFAWSHFEAK